MKKFIVRASILIFPLIVWSVFVFIIDPFNYFNVSKLVSKEKKEANAKSVNNLLYQTIDFKNSPGKYVIIGDSRTASLPLDEIDSISKHEYKSLCTNAAKMNEIFDLIYYANSINKLKHVVVGINFNMFNQFGYTDRVSDVKAIIRNPLKYIFNLNIAEVSYYITRSILTDKNISSTPPMTKEEFWNWFISIKANHWYGKYKFPEQLYNDLKKLDLFAKNNNIELTLIIVPHHRQFHDRLVDFGLAEEEKKFKEIMTSLNASVIDYDYENTITTKKDNFLDPVHYNHEIGLLIVDEVWNKNYKIGRMISNKGNSSDKTTRK